VSSLQLFRFLQLPQFILGRRAYQVGQIDPNGGRDLEQGLQPWIVDIRFTRFVSLENPYVGRNPARGFFLAQPLGSTCLSDSQPDDREKEVKGCFVDHMHIIETVAAG
jgi:hypothetical protein